MSRYIRTNQGVPPVSLFADSQGTPLMIDLDTDAAYFLKKNVVTPLSIVPQRVTAAYGGMRIGTPRSIVLGASWTRITNYNSSIFDGAVGVIEDRPAGSLLIENPGIYTASLGYDLIYDEANAARSFFVRLFDVDDNVPLGQPIEWYSGRNTFGSNVSITFGFDTLAASKHIAIEVGGGDAFTNVTLKSGVFMLNSIG